MQYIKLGPLKLPFSVRIENGEKIIQICMVKIPFSSYSKDGKKYYRVFGRSFYIPFMDKCLVTRGQTNYQRRVEMTEIEMKEIASKLFEEKVGYIPDFENPRSMNEKIYWFKFNYHDPMITKCCDKYAVKDYVTEKLGPGHVIPVLGHWEDAENIEFAKLPSRYVLKVNWSSGYNIIVKDKNTINEKEIRAKVSHWMQPHQNCYYQAFNWGYKDMKPVVYAEQYMEQMDGQLYDYKFFCCNGKVKFWFIATDRFGEKQLTHDFFNMDFEKLDFNYAGFAHSDLKLEKPRFYDEMVKAAETLAMPFPFVRVDFYEIECNYYVGEMTFYPAGGNLPFDPEEWDYKLGEYIHLPEK